MSTHHVAKFIVANGLAIPGIIILLIMAWRSDGFYHPDEHYQLLEYANFKSGLTLKEGLAWEFHDQIRPGLQPFIAYAVMSGLRTLGLTNPFHLAFMLRLFSALLSLILILQTARYIQTQHASRNASQGFLVLSFFLWLAPFLHVRFSSENWSALSFFSGILFVLNSTGDSVKKKIFKLLLGGLLVSLAFQLRYQMAFAILGFLAWLLVFRKLNLQQWFYFIAGTLFGLVIGFAVDYWLYHSWQFTPYIYFHSNITHGMASTFGTAPWWYYFTELFKTLGPGLNFLLLGLFLIGLWRSRRHPFTWMLIPFIIGHVLVGHKELRFMFPMLIPFLYFVSTGWPGIPDRIRQHILIKPIAVVLMGINILLLIYRLKEPAEKLMPYYRYLYDRAPPSGNAILVFYYEPNSTVFTNSIYGPGNLRLTFYRPPKLKQIPIRNPSEMDQFDISKTQNFVINVYPTLPPSRTKNQGLAFKYSAWLFSDLRKFQFFKKTTLPWKIFYLQNK